MTTVPTVSTDGSKTLHIILIKFIGCVKFCSRLNVWLSCKLLFSTTYGVINLDMSIRFSLKSRPSEGIPRPEMSQIKAEISLHTNLKLIFHKNVGWQGYQWIP